MNKLFTTLSLAFFASRISAQSASFSANQLLLYGVVGVCAVLIIWAMMSLASNLLKIEASKYGIDPNSSSVGILPGLRDIFKAKKPSYANEGSFFHLTRGYDIRLDGEAALSVAEVKASRFAICPADFHGMSPIPKLEVQQGDEVKAGDALFFDKKRPEIQYVAPVSGEIVEIVRGEKRAISEVIILADKEIQHKKFDIPNLDQVDRSSLASFLASSGLWSLLKERPFDRVPSLTEVPVNIFISTFDTAPLAPDLSFVVQGQEAAFQKGLDVLAKLTSGQVHLGLDARGEKSPAGAFTNAQGVQKHWFKGPHPAGNVGVQIHHIAPISPKVKVWTVGVQEVITIGNMFLTGKFHANRVVALTGAELKNPQYVHTFQGASVQDLLRDHVTSENVRFVSGDVLSGKEVDQKGFLSFHGDQVTVLKEGNDYELFGWLLPLSPRPSVSGTIPSYGSDHKFEANTNTHGEKRAFVVSGLYETVLPMDIYPMHLMKAITSQNLDKMEGLGLAELTEEDVALCEFVCPSKNPMQAMLRQGLEYLHEQS
ncbi:MAG: Na(+)-translocating NADH-quinone reductase subunit A [Saprospiraceae bacterium]|jgi:Na+-transporting NADH:ubiquinone oxidoreductase subunit A|nr:Na(+)-translocating NADH-quinone reductase subunit A [Saprospiraceae bacterium]